MKAKMLRGQKIPEAGEYQCQRCDGQFICSGGQLICLACDNHKLSDFVLIYIEDDLQEDQMYSAIDWHAGD